MTPPTRDWPSSETGSCTSGSDEDKDERVARMKADSLEQINSILLMEGERMVGANERGPGQGQVASGKVRIEPPWARARLAPS